MNIVITFACLVTLPTFLLLPIQERSLVGKWQIVKFVFNDDSIEDKIRMSFSDMGKLEVNHPGGETHRMNYRANFSKTPHHINLVDEQEDEHYIGIFRFDERKLVIFLLESQDEAKRPTEFGDGAGKDEVLMILQRVDDKE